MALPGAEQTEELVPRMRKKVELPALRPTVAPGSNPNTARRLGRTGIKIDGLQRRGPVSLRFGIRPMIEVQVSSLKSHRCKLKIEIDGFKPTDAAVAPQNRNGEISGRIKPLGRLLSLARPSRVTHADFVLLNFFDTRKRTVHRAGDYEVILEPHEYTTSLIKKLGFEGGFAITHSGRVSRVDGKSLTLREARYTVEVLGWYLTFARGAYSYPIFVEAPSSTSKEAFRDWSMSRSSEWRSEDSWFDPQESLNLFDDALPGFIASFGKHGRALRVAIDWYVQARAGRTIEAQIILAVSGLEILATLIVAGSFDRTAVQAFDKRVRRAADKIREMLGCVRGRAGIPGPLRNLRNWALKEAIRNKKLNTEEFDGPWAITSLRNIVHANQVANVLNCPRRARLEAAQLAFFWFEAAMLHICNVPWSQLSGRKARPGGRWSRWRKSRVSKR